MDTLSNPNPNPLQHTLGYNTVFTLMERNIQLPQRNSIPGILLQRKPLL